MIKKILVANRGEIALRVLRAAQDMNIDTVAIYSEADRESLHVKFAGESVCIGPAAPDKSYLNMPVILAAAEISEVDSVHPGYGFLSENARFAELVKNCGYIFVGPDAESIKLMGDKVMAKKVMSQAGMPILPGTKEAITDEEALLRVAKEIGYPILLKAAHGGGGRGMKLVTEPEALVNSFKTASQEALLSFGNGSMYAERFLQNPHHIEIQIAADNHGNAIYLGERECSVQRRHQKLIEESPSPIITSEIRKRMGETAVKAIQSFGYHNVGTIEFLVDSNKNFYFMEMNTRIQVEHPVTEMVTGIDLVQLQFRLASGEKLPYRQQDIALKGHSIECRINAEHPRTFAPCPGTISAFNIPGGPGVRVDTFICEQAVINPHYDSLIAKLIVYAENRQLAIRRMERALREFIVEGIETNIPFHKEVMTHPDFIAGNYDTKFVEKLSQTWALR